MSQDGPNAASPAKKRWHPVPTGWLDAQRRERDVIRAELSQVRGFMPLLMKVRNGGDWSPLERAQLMANVRAIAHISPYVLVLALPGSFIALPALAWWLDRRRQNRDRATARMK